MTGREGLRAGAFLVPVRTKAKVLAEALSEAAFLGTVCAFHSKALNGQRKACAFKTKRMELREAA